jgi:hypothetical protein
VLLVEARGGDADEVPGIGGRDRRRPGDERADGGFVAPPSLASRPLPAQAVSGQVVVFSTEAQPLDTYQDLSGCRQLPPPAHMLDNPTDAPVKVHADTFCTLPATLPPGIGALAPGASSFSA